MDEWLKGYNTVQGYGFVGLSKDLLRNDKSAMKVFNEIDDNGMILPLILKVMIVMIKTIQAIKLIMMKMG